MRYGSFVVAVFAAFFWIAPSRADELSLGQVIFVRPYARLTANGHEVPRSRINIPAKVETVDGDLLWIGSAWIKREDALTPEQAVLFYSDLIRDFPARAELWNGRGQAWEAKGNYDSAIKDYEEASRLKPGDAMVHMNMANAWVNIGDNDRAIDEYLSALRLNPSNPRIYSNLGMLADGKREYERAVQLYSWAIRLEPNMADTYRKRANSWCHLEKYQNAIDDLTSAIEIDPRDIDFYYNRGNAYRLLGDDRKAIRDFTQAIKDAPTMPEGYWGRAWVQAASPNEMIRDGDGAVQDARKACDLSNWTTPELLCVLAASFAEKGDFPNASMWVAKAIELIKDEEQKSLPQEMLELFKKGRPYRYELKTPIGDAGPTVESK